ncbi:MAG: sigma-70 family RNA polymerase sigma factor, partial [Planctomycetota bacterium]|nr:sigma-70 family RNA polymerase sigma factor [Planctomycetota bacterium]
EAQAGENPSHAESVDDSWDLLNQEIEKLPAECREVLMLYYYSESTYQELGDMLEVSAATINARLTKARKLLRYRLSEAGS